MNRTHAEGVTEGERQALLRAEIGESVPDEETLTADDEIVLTKRRQGVEERFGPAGEIAVQERLALAIKNADIHRPRVKIDAAARLVSPGVQSHAVPPLEGLLAILKATAWVAPKEACMSFKSFERTRSAAASGCAGHQFWCGAQLQIR